MSVCPMIPRALALRRSFSLAVHVHDIEPAVSLSDRKIRGLVHSLDTGADHAVVWSNYNDVLNALGASALPLSLHQQVLRQCTSPKLTHRQSISKQISRRTFSSPFHIHESRFKAVVQNITSTGASPALEDYNFILDQLASVGYYTGAFALYKHMTRAAVVPDAKSFGLCFRAMAVRLNLPTPHNHRPDLITHITDIFQQLMHDHQRLAIPMSTPNMDSILRILKHTRDRPAFESVLATAYAIDLYNPDRLALEYANPASPSATVPLPFTTAALNTTLDMLGRFGDISHLVSAFEVLTQPLPQAAQHFFNSFEDDEDDVSTGAVALPPPRIPAPHAVPNTTTYNILLRHVCQHGHPVLARHYLVQALQLDRQTAWELRQTVGGRQLHPERLAEIPAPRFALSAQMLLPVLGLTNRDKNFQLMRWLQSKMHAILKRQRLDLQFYERLAARLGLSAASAPATTLRTEQNPPPPDTNAPPTNDAPLTDDASPPPPPTPKPFDPLLHIHVLRTNLAELTTFAARLKYDTPRTAQRVKERLGRRVWAERDIYLTTEDTRLLVARDAWRAMVNFRPVPAGVGDGAYARPRARGPFTASAGPRPEAAAGRAGGGAAGGQVREGSSMAVARASLGAPKSIITPPIPVLWHMPARTT